MHTHIPSDFFHPARRTQSRGFTLIELLVTVAIAALLLAVAVPSFNRLMISSRLTTQANNAVNLLSYARAEAVKRGVNVQISADGAITALPPAPAASTSITQAVARYADISTSSPVPALIATPMGLLRAPNASTGYSGLIADISSTATSDNHRCIYLYTGTTVASCTDSQTCKPGAPNDATCK